MVRSRTVMCASAGTSRLRSDPENVEDDREDSAGADDPDDAGDDGRGSRVADAGRAGLRLHAPQAPRERDQHTVNRRLEDTADAIADRDRVEGLLEIEPRR